MADLPTDPGNPGHPQVWVVNQITFVQLVAAVAVGVILGGVGAAVGLAMMGAL